MNVGWFRAAFSKGHVSLKMAKSQLSISHQSSKSMTRMLTTDNRVATFNGADFRTYVASDLCGFYSLG